MSPLLATGGQPSDFHLKNLSNEGFDAVINLGLEDAVYAVPNENEIVEAQGIEYFHIPVIFESPQISQYFEFDTLVKSLAGKKLFIHCAANKRVSVFVALFRILNEKTPYLEAIKEVNSIWQPDEVWNGFIQHVVRKANFDE